MSSTDITVGFLVFVAGLIYVWLLRADASGREGEAPHARHTRDFVTRLALSGLVFLVALAAQAIVWKMT